MVESSDRILIEQKAYLTAQGKVSTSHATLKNLTPLNARELYRGTGRHSKYKV